MNCKGGILLMAGIIISFTTLSLGASVTGPMSKPSKTDTRPTVSNAELDYQYGNLVEDKGKYKEAFDSFLSSAKGGYAKAQRNVGYYYLVGQGVEKNPAEAVKWLRKAAEQGNADAQYNLGNCYSDGKGVEKDQVQAVKWLHKAADQGEAGAQNNLAFCYVAGKGVEKDQVEAVKWFRKAADQGEAGAQNNLAFCYAKGEGVKKNLAQAVKWYRKAAEQGAGKAQSVLALCYYHGQGVIKDWVEAYKWALLAGGGGQDVSNIKEELRQKLTREEVLESQSRAKEFQAALKQKKSTQGDEGGFRGLTEKKRKG